MSVAATSLSGPAGAGAAPAAETSVSQPTPPAPQPDAMLSFLAPNERAILEQIASEAHPAPPSPTLEPEPAPVEATIETTPEETTPVAEGDQDVETEEEEMPAGIEAMQKRIAKITAQKHEAREAAEAARKELEAARAELDKLRKAPPAQAPTLDQPLNHVTTLEALEEEETKAEKVREWCLENWDGGTVPDGKDGEVYHAPETVRRMFAHFDGVLRKQIPARKTYLAEREGHDALAEQEHPFLADPKSEGAQLAARFLATVPGVAALPYARRVAAAYAEGELARRARLEKAKTPAAAAAPPRPKPAQAPAKVLAPAPPVGSSGAPGLRNAPAASSAQADAALAELARNPNDPDALANYFAALGTAAA